MSSRENSWQASIPPDAKFLVVRRDNIGDLVCTTPLIRLLRARFPQARIAALVNGYNKGVLSGNRDLDVVYHYRKAKHERKRWGIPGAYLARIKLIWTLRRAKFDFLILANSGFQKSSLRFARLIGASHVVGYVPAFRPPRIIDIPVWPAAGEVVHEVLAVNRLLAPLGIHDKSPRASVYPDENRVARIRATLKLAGCRQVVGIHISARNKEGRWAIENIVALITELAKQPDTRILLLWSPGDVADLRHPGDDLKAANVLAECGGLPVQGCPTPELEELVAMLHLCDIVICSDGGAMHIAAALGKPVVALFGSDPARWHPWQTLHEVLRAPSGLACDITVKDVTQAYGRLCRKNVELVA